MKQSTDTKQDVEIARHCVQIANNTADIHNSKVKLDYISKQVSNHIPHQINDLEKKFLEAMLKQKSWLIGIMVSMLTILIALVVQLVKG